MLFKTIPSNSTVVLQYDFVPPACFDAPANKLSLPMHLACAALRYSLVPSFMLQVLRDGADAANELASQTLEWARDAMGIPSLKKFQ